MGGAALEESPSQTTCPWSNRQGQCCRISRAWSSEGSFEVASAHVMYLFLTSFSKSPDGNTNYFCNAETLRHMRPGFTFMGLFFKERSADVRQMTVTFESSGCIYNQPAHLLLNVFLFVEACLCVERISQERWPISPIVLPIFYCLLSLITRTLGGSTRWRWNFPEFCVLWTIPQSRLIFQNVASISSLSPSIAHTLAKQNLLGTKAKFHGLRIHWLAIIHTTRAPGWHGWLSSNSRFWLRSWSQGHEIKPCIGLHAGRGIWLRFSLSFCPYSPHHSVHTYSLPQKNIFCV